MRTDQPKLETTPIIRPPIAADDQRIAKLFTLIAHAEYTVEKLHSRRQRYARRNPIERVAVVDGYVRGWVELIEDSFGTGGFLRLVVEPGFRSRGIGKRLFEEISSTPAFAGYKKLRADVRDDDPAALAFGERRGFAARGRMFESTLDLTTFKPYSFIRMLTQFKTEGLSGTTMAELGDTEEARHKLWELEYVTDADIPGIDPAERVSWEDCRDIVFTATWYDPAGEFIALDGERWIGISGVAEVGPGEFYNQHTAVLPEYRGRGIATALKIAAITYAQQKGGRLMRTNNNEGNAPMLAINRKLGYLPEPGWYELERRQNHD